MISPFTCHFIASLTPTYTSTRKATPHIYFPTMFYGSLHANRKVSFVHPCPHTDPAFVPEGVRAIIGPQHLHALHVDVSNGTGQPKVQTSIQ